MLEIPKDIIERHKDLRPTYRRVYWILRDCFVYGSIKMPEDSEGRLTEEMIAEALGVSRTPVRTAMSQLKSEGFLQNVSKGRMGVSEFTDEDKSSLVEAAMMLEGSAAALAARRVTEEDIEMLKELNESIRKFDAGLRDESGLRGIRDLHMSFHLMVAKLSGNKYLYKYIVEIRNMMRMLAAEDSIGYSTYPNKIAPLHSNLIEALERGDSSSAKAIIRYEIQSARSLYMRGQSDYTGKMVNVIIKNRDDRENGVADGSYYLDEPDLR